MTFQLPRRIKQLGVVVEFENGQKVYLTANERQCDHAGFYVQSETGIGEETNVHIRHLLGYSLVTPADLQKQITNIAGEIEQ